jgi:hypothetical protein
LALGAALGPLRGRVGAGASAVLAVALGVLGAGLLGAGVYLGRAGTDARADGGADAGAGAGGGADAPGTPGGTAWIGAVGVAGALVLTLVARDFAAPVAGSARLVHLFTYNYARPFPAREFDYRAALLGFALLAALASATLAWPRARALGGRMLLGAAAGFCAWALYVYMPDLAQHWSQRGLFERYYAARGAGTTESGAAPLAAYAMNWKGENFYTGGRAAMIDCGLPLCSTRLDTWLLAHRGERVFVVSEHGRAGTVLDAVRRRGGTGRTLTDAEDQVMFVLIEAQL